ncbi:MAG: protein-L-isoaspartate(D-aspartate) O-methyltransferase [Deltaproteobacteria bacterium]|nr:protein-L-isoaspartate(D-aspartate) O-methyltransferase [Deltaproteobacteria bacterium]MBW2217305.1 protein-L-isoaspartate(D-aspartate) O-methyltransferase [Deltaproteobacteria bacterium]
MKTASCHILFLSFLILLLQTCSVSDTSGFDSQRHQMVKEQIIARGVKDPRVIKAMEKIPRHDFVPIRLSAHSYMDTPLPIGLGQTISQPYIVAFMTEALDLRSGDRILEIGTGSGYQAAVLAELVSAVYTIEILPELGERAKETLEKLQYKNIHVKIGDGFKGWPEMAPFDAVIVTCAPEQIPPALVDQLKEGGRMIIPVGKEGGVQKLVKLTKHEGKVQTQAVMDVRFVPMVEGGSENP